MNYIVLLQLTLVLIICIVSSNAIQTTTEGRGGKRKEFKVNNQFLKKFHESPGPLKNDFTCTACVIVLTIIDWELEHKGKDWIQKELKEQCKKLKDQSLKYACDMVADYLLGEIIEALIQKYTPSEICNKFSFMHCNGCSLNHINPTTLKREEGKEAKETQLKGLLISYILEKAKKLPYREHLKGRNVKKSTNELLPLVDIDEDKFSDLEQIYRGSDWRGRDCDDHHKGVYPTKIEDKTMDPSIDQNCNGIAGINPVTKKSYEEELCEGTDSHQVVMFGDSASSGFHIPPEWFHLQNLSNIVDLWTTVNDELDWPQLTYSTGFKPEIEGESIYMEMRRRNLCSHRAYQNVGHNGHRMRDFADQVAALHMSPQDKPFIGMMAYIGNDICKHSLKDMTSVDSYKADMIKGLRALDRVAPKGSKLLVLGLVDGRVLWDTMNNRIHPLGVPYKNVYSFLTCTDANPCNTWLNNNATIRDLASQHAALLSKTAQQTVDEISSSLQNITISFYPFPLQEALAYAKEHDIPAYTLIEPVDGFHPSVHVADRLFYRFFMKHISEKLPHWLPAENPHNPTIKKLFGDQGGH